MTNVCIGCGGKLRPRNKTEYCSKCLKYYNKIIKLKPKKPEVTMVGAVGLENITREKLKEIRSRVIGNNGTVLKGEEGIKYMEEHAAENPGYAQRLKEYYST